MTILLCNSVTLRIILLLNWWRAAIREGLGGVCNLRAPFTSKKLTMCALISCRSSAVESDAAGKSQMGDRRRGERLRVRARSPSSHRHPAPPLLLRTQTAAGTCLSLAHLSAVFFYKRRLSRIAIYIIYVHGCRFMACRANTYGI